MAGKRPQDEHLIQYSQRHRDALARHIAAWQTIAATIPPYATYRAERHALIAQIAAHHRAGNLPRVPTRKALAAHLGISPRTLRNIKDPPLNEVPLTAPQAAAALANLDKHRVTATRDLGKATRALIRLVDDPYRCCGATHRDMQKTFGITPWRYWDWAKRR